MSVERHRNKWRVRWRENGKQRARTFDRKGAADVFDRKVKDSLQLGPHLARELERTSVTLDAFLADGFEDHAVTLSPATRHAYGWAINNHLQELLDEPLIGLGVSRLMAHQRMLLDNGRTAETVRQVMSHLSGMLRVAVEHDLIATNPVRSVRRPPADEKEDVNPLEPAQLEQLLAAFDGRARVVVALCGHLGLRPQEARKVLWSDFDGSRCVVSRARTKSSAARTRMIDVPAATRRILNEWRLESAGRGDQPIIGQLTASGLKNWANQHLTPVATQTTGRDDVTLYTLRHTHASTLHYCGWTVPEAAKRMGHSPVVHMRTYAHPIEKIGRQRWRDLDDLIAEARTAPAGAPVKAAPSS